MKKQTLKEKIKFSEQLVDKYLNEIQLPQVTAAGVQAGTYAFSTASGAIKDLKGYYDKKMAQRKERLKQQEEEKNKLMAQKQQALRNKNTA